MTMTSPQHDAAERDGIERAAALFQAMSDPARLLILQHLFRGPHRVRDLIDHLGLAQSTVSAHVATLRDAGLVGARPDGRSTYYSLADADLVAGVLGAAEAILSTTGDPVVLCHHRHGEVTDEVVA